jgi:uncharacterized protein YjiK
VRARLRSPWVLAAAVFVVAAVALQWAARARRAPLPPAGMLVLERALDVEGPGDFQPSGLALSAGRLYTVSDKTSAALFELVLGERAVARPAIAVAGGDADNLDFEGLAAEPDGSFLVVSEARAAVLRVGSSTSWLPIDFATPARRAGLLATRGAGLEGVARFAGNIVVAAERQPRGLVLAEPGGEARALWLDRTRLPPAPGRPPDFADLTVDRGKLYALARNSDAVVELAAGGDSFSERRWWSFAAATAHRYTDTRFGMAEGLALDATHVYVILDNNGAPRATAPTDHRPLLFIFQRPADL